MIVNDNSVKAMILENQAVILKLLMDQNRPNLVLNSKYSELEERVDATKSMSDYLLSKARADYEITKALEGCM